MSAVVAFGPSLIDICAKLPDDRYAACQQLLGLTGPGWRRLDDYHAVRRLVRAISGWPGREGAVLDAVRACPDLFLAAGSTTLGMLTAMPAGHQARSTYISVLGRVAGSLDPFSQAFTDAVSAIGITHELTVASGHNPVGFVLSGRNDPRKTLATYAGVAPLFGGTDLQRLDPELVLIDTYELLAGEMAAFLAQTIEAGRFPIALSLGNEQLLAGDLGERIRGYVRSKRLFVLCGTAKEYKALFPGLDAKLATPEGFRDHPLRGCVPYALMTFAENGMAAHWAGDFASVGAFQVDRDRIVNTSGAGDTAAGSFCGGVLDGGDPAETLRRSAQLAASTLLVLHPHLLKEGLRGCS
jgi:sugar/nucleoside kinase (ribokinase family)